MQVGYSKKKKDSKKKKKDNWLEAEVFRIMEKSLETAMDEALKELFKEW